LFRLDPDKDCLIIDHISNGQWKWMWSREDIGVRNKAYLKELLLEISLVDIIVEEDSFVWDMAIDGIFLIGDTCRLIDAKILPTLLGAWILLPLRALLAMVMWNPLLIFSLIVILLRRFGD
ncbi:hypothetical protein Tco_0077062, partial [Tanacetum coccineum]